MYPRRVSLNIKWRRKCKILAVIDLTWRSFEFLYSIVGIVKMGGSTEFSIFEIRYPTSTFFKRRVIQILDDRVYDFLLSPFLVLLYFIAFFLQFSSSIFLARSCSSKSFPETERASCRIWIRIAILSIFILIIRFLLPLIVISIFNVTYAIIRTIFKFVGIVIVYKHEEEMINIIQHYSDPKPMTYIERNRLESTSSTAFGRGGFSEDSQSSFKDSIRNDRFEQTESNQQFVRPRVHRALLHIEKDHFKQAIDELKIAQKYDPTDRNIEKLLRLVEEMLRIESEALANSKNQPVHKNYYEILGLSTSIKSISEDEIRKAFRSQSLKHHPDKHFSASDKIKARERALYEEIREAYDTLGDSKKRAIYNLNFQSPKENLNNIKIKFRKIYAVFDSKYLTTLV